jgi:hypothetical protein
MAKTRLLCILKSSEKLKIATVYGNLVQLFWTIYLNLVKCIFPIQRKNIDTLKTKIKIYQKGN